MFQCGSSENIATAFLIYSVLCADVCSNVLTEQLISSGLKQPLPGKGCILSVVLCLTQFRSKLVLTRNSRDNSEIFLPSSTIKWMDSF